ncbi:MAG: AraC family transcriptional regulator [Oscillospiraceae bacterium]|nr:AraC family transcriptional regulator [Oscillospiraceae bacterium]
MEQEYISLREARYPFQISCADIRGQEKTWLFGGPGGTNHIGLSQLHQHDFYELVYVLDGEMTHHLENGTIRYRKGEACIMNPNVAHCEGGETDCTLIFLYFREDFMRSLFDRAQTGTHPPQYLPGPCFRFYEENSRSDIGTDREYLDFTCTGPGSSRRTSALLDAISKEALTAGTGYIFRIQALILQLFEALEDPAMYHLSRIRVSSGSEELIFTRLMRCLEKQKGRISCKELAAQLHYSSNYLNRIAKHQSGKTLLELRQNMILHEAERLLTETDDSISSIVSALGFTNRTHFYRIFQKVSGMSPMDYRKTYRT